MSSILTLLATKKSQSAGGENFCFFGGILFVHYGFLFGNECVKSRLKKYMSANLANATA